MDTGNLTPKSSHIEVIPRFRAMRPVRIDKGVHFGEPLVVLEGETIAFEWACLVNVTGGR